MSFEADTNINEQQPLEEDQPMNDTSSEYQPNRDTEIEANYRQQWFDAARRGKIDDIKCYLRLGANIGWKNDQNSTALHICARYGHKELVTLLLEGGATVDATDKDLETPLHLAVWHGQTDIAALLLDYGADVKVEDNHAETALHLAAKGGHKEVLNLLLTYGAAVDTKNGELNTPLHLASGNGHTEVVQLLLNHGAAVDAKNKESSTALHKAAYTGFKEIVQLLLSQGAAVDARGLHLNTPLHLASWKGQKEVMLLLLSHGAIIDAKNSGLNTALHLAAELGHNDIVDMLLNHGATIDAEDSTLNTALHLAAVNGQKETVDLLLKHGASVDARDLYFENALHTATKYGYIDIVKLLLNHGAAVDNTSGSLNTALHLAALYGHENIVQLLLKKGAAIDAKNDESKTALHLATMGGYTEVILQLFGNRNNGNQKCEYGKLLPSELSQSGDVQMETLVLDYSADIEAVDNNGETPFIAAAKAGQLDIVSLFSDRGANIEASDSNSLTALHWAAKDGNIAVVDLLLQIKAHTEAMTNHGDTPLHLAAEFNHFNVVATLLKYGANIDAVNEDHKTPIQVAIFKGSIDMIYQLKNAGAKLAGFEDGKFWIIYVAAEAGQIELVKRGLGMISSTDKRIFYMNAALCRASQHGQVDMVSYLLDNGADIEARNEDGYRPLFLACQHPGLVSMLIHRGACIEARNEDNLNQTALHYFTALSQIEALHILLNCNCNIHSTDDDNNTALHYAASNGDCEIAALLIEQGIDINSKNGKGATVLHIAIENDFLDLTSMLTDHRIDIDAKEFTLEETALHVAINKGCYKAIPLLLSRHADVNAKDTYGNTALHLAARLHLIKQCALLIEHGANVNSIDNAQDTPLAIAIITFNLDLICLLLESGASIYNSNYIQAAVNYSTELTMHNWKPRLLDVLTLLINAGADAAGIQISEEVEKRIPTLADTLTKLSKRSMNKEKPPLNRISVVMDEQADQANHTDVVLTEFIANSGNEYKISLANERWLNHTKHKYGYGFPPSKYLQLDDALVIRENFGSLKSTQSIPCEQSLNLWEAISIDIRAIQVIKSLLDCFNTKLFISDYFFMLEMDRHVDTIPPKISSEFDKMKGIIREPGRLIVQIPQKETSLSIQTWHSSNHPYLRFINSVIVCRRSSYHHNQDVFSDILGGSEQTISPYLHAILIAGLSIVSIAGGDGLVEKLVMAILGVKLDPIHNNPQNTISVDWQVRNRRKCPCKADPVQNPLSPIAAAKAVGIDIWRERQEETVNRVWDLLQDKLEHNVDARNVMFITHRWSDPEILYQHVISMKRWRRNGISRKSEKLHRIRKTLMKYTRYVWIDTICIDKSNLSELDEAIRSMYKWYANCAAVVLDSDTPLDVWCKRGWCLQEGAAAGVLCGISKKGTLATIQELAIEQQHDLCTLDLHLYYRPGNASEILARMDVRKTTRNEDMAYALAGIFSIHLTLAYGEGLKSRERLLHELATQKGDLSFLSFKTTQTTFSNYLPSISNTNYLIANCTQSSAPIMVSHFGICFEVQFVKGPDASQILEKLNGWRNLKFANGRFLGVEELLEAADKSEHQNSASVELAIVHDIRSIMLVETYNADWQTGGEQRPIIVCYRLQCCQIEENEFERLFKERDAKFARMWLSDKPAKAGTNKAKSVWSRRRGMINDNHNGKQKDLGLESL